MSLLGGLSKGNRAERMGGPFPGSSGPTEGVGRGCPCGHGSGSLLGDFRRVPSPGQAPPLASWSQACAGEQPCEHGGVVSWFGNH